MCKPEDYVIADLVLEEAKVMQLADALKTLKQAKKLHEDIVKEINAQIARVDEVMTKAMIDDELQNFNRAGQTFYLATNLLVSPVPEKKAELYDALKDNGYGSIVQESVNAKTLQATVKEIVGEDDKLPEWLEGLVNTFAKTSVGMRKAGK